jgi:hypothetical protein
LKLNIDLSKLASIFLVLFFFIAYIGMTSSAYALMMLMIILRINKGMRINFYDFFILLCLVVFATFKIMQVGAFVGEAILRYYLGVIIVYWFIKTNFIKLDIQKLIFYYCICVFVEAVVINTLFDPFRYLPNYPLSVFEGNIASHYTKFMGFYQRPYSIGMNSSTSVTILCGMLMYRNVLIGTGEIIEDKKIEIMGGITVVMFASGVGIGLYFFYLIYKFKLLTVERGILLFIICLFLIPNYELISSTFSSDSILQKVSAGYINFLIDFKATQIDKVVHLLNENGNSMLIGQAFKNKSEIILQSDFAWNDFFQCLGIFGIVLFFMFLVNKINRNSVFPVLLFLVGAIHYGGMFTLAGQIILALVLYNFSSTSEGDEIETEATPI